MRLPAGGKSFRCVAIIVTTLAALAGSGSAGAATARQRVTMAVNPTTTGSPFFIAADQGYFERFGIDAVLVRSIGDAAIVTALNAGSVDLVQGVPRPVTFELVNRGGRIRAAAAGTEVPTTCTATALIVGAGFAAAHPRTTIADLRGARIGAVSVNEGILVDFYMAAWLKSAGLTLRDVEMIRIPLPAMPDALASGTVQAVVAFEPYTTLILERGVGVILGRAQQVGARLPSSLIFIGPTLRNQPGLAARVLAGYLLGVRDHMAPNVKRNPQTLQILARALGTNEEFIRKTCWQPIPKDGHINVRMLEVWRDWLFTSGHISQPTPMGRFIDEQYLREAWHLLAAMGERIR